MKKIIFLICCFFPFLSYAQDSASCESENDSYKKWECRVETRCSMYKENRVSFDGENYKKAQEYKDITVADVVLVSNRSEKPLRKAASIYKNNMNNIYNCSMLSAQVNGMNTISKKFLNYDKSGSIKQLLEPKIKQNLQRLELKSKQIGCKNITKDLVKKETVLKETTYETCKFDFYMDYLKDYYGNVENALNIDESTDKDTAFLASEVAGVTTGIQSAINQEVNHVYQTFPIAFTAYNEYENNFMIHFMLDILYNDFVVYRENLHNALNPFNQLVYKLSNVMKQ